MSIKLPKLPYKESALEPHISRETLSYHYGKHHRGYVEKTNKLIEGTPFEDKSLEEIIQSATGALYNNAAQVWNHTFYWNCMSPKGGGSPKGEIADLLSAKFGSFSNFKKEFAEAGTKLFGSGYVWLVEMSGGLKILSAKDADNPLTAMQKPILCCDVWEHAYYLDYRNARAKYLEGFWNIVNWDFATENLNVEKEAVVR